MKYMLFTYRDPSVQLDPEQRKAVPAAVAAWCEEMDARGVRLEGRVLGPLRRAGRFGFAATSWWSVTARSPSRAFTSPGSTSSNVPTSIEALEVASKNPGASFGILELRPIEPCRTRTPRRSGARLLA